MINNKKITDDNLLVSGKLTVNLLNQQVHYDGTPIILPELSYQLLVTLMKSWPHAMTQDELIVSVWGKIQVQNSTLSQRVKLLRQSLKTVNCDPQFIALVRGKGYRFAEVVNVEVVCLNSSDHDIENKPLKVSQSDINLAELNSNSVEKNSMTNIAKKISSKTLILDTKNPSKKRKHFILMTSLILLTAVFLLIVTSFPTIINDTNSSNKLDGDFSRKTLTIIPFNTTEGTSELQSIDDSYLGNSFSQELLYTLTAMKGLKVIAYDPLTRQQLRQLTPQKIGKKLNVRYIVNGNIRRVDQLFRVSVQLLSTKDNELLFGESYEVDYSKISQLKYDVATSISKYFKQNKDEIFSLREKYNLVKPKAYDLYLKALDYSKGNTYQDNFNAKLLLENAHSLFPSCPDISIAYANVLNNDFSFGRSDKKVLKRASDLANQTINLYPERSYGYASLARNYLLQEEYEKAEEYFTLALQINAENINALTGKSYLQIINKEFKRAAKNIELIATLDPGSTRSLILSATLHFELGALEVSRDAFKSVIKVEPDNINALIGLSQLALKEDNIEEAIKYYLVADKFDSNSPKVKSLELEINVTQRKMKTS